MKTFIKSILAILILIILLFTTSLALELTFIQKLIVRQIIVYFFMLIEVFIIFRYILLINK